MASERSSREGILLTLLEAFRQGGFDGVSLSQISELTGLGKASLYHHFPGGKAEMALAVMTLAGQWLEHHVFGPLERPGDPRARLDAVIAALEGFYQQGEKSCLLDVMPLGGGPEVQAAVGDVMRRLLAGFTRLAEDAGVPPGPAARRAERALVGLQGSLVLCRGLGTPEPFQHQVQDLKEGFLAREA